MKKIKILIFLCLAYSINIIYSTFFVSEKSVDGFFLNSVRADIPTEGSQGSWEGGQGGCEGKGGGVEGGTGGGGTSEGGNSEGGTSEGNSSGGGSSQGSGCDGTI